MEDRKIAKCECWDCRKQFIIGKQSLEGCDTGFPVCPYCGKGNPEETVWDDREEKEMGCMSIMLPDVESMKNVRIYLEDGDVIGTKINGTEEEIREYYEVGSIINTGKVVDRMVKIEKVDIQEAV